MHQAKLNNILALSSQERYRYLIRRAADFEEVWLIKDGAEFIAFVSNAAIPIFPEQEFAEAFLMADWQNHSVEQVEINDFLYLLDQWQQQQVNVAGFPGIDSESMVVKAEEMKSHLLRELQLYE